MSYACAPSWMDEPRQIRIGARGGRLASRTPWNIYALVAVLAAVNRHAERFTDMTDAIIVTVDSVRSRASTQETLLTLAVPQEHAPMIAKFLGMIHQNVAVAFAEVGRQAIRKGSRRTVPPGMVLQSEGSGGHRDRRGISGVDREAGVLRDCAPIRRDADKSGWIGMRVRGNKIC